jgi:hypothetical protein
MVSKEEKEMAIDLAKMNGVKNASKLCNVPLKSLKRWLVVGSERKKGGGRKTKDPHMEKLLYAWYLEMKKKSMIVTGGTLKLMAIQFSN